MNGIHIMKCLISLCWRASFLGICPIFHVVHREFAEICFMVYLNATRTKLIIFKIHQLHEYIPVRKEMKTRPKDKYQK